VVLSALVAALTISVGPALAYCNENRDIPSKSIPFTQPLALQGWNVLPAAGPWRPVYAGADREVNASLLPEGASEPAVDFSIVYYGRIREGHSLIATTNRLWDAEIWRAVERSSVVAELGPQAVELDETILRAASERRLVWSSYWMDGRFTTSGLTIKLLQLKTAFTGNEASVLIAFSTPIDGAVEDARARLKTAFASFGDPSKFLTPEVGADVALGALD
jgi:EpsI family protein